MLSRQSIERAREELTDYKNKVRTRLIEEATARDWCSEADDFLESIDLEPRIHPKEYDITVEFTVVDSVTLGRRLADPDEASDAIDSWDVKYAIEDKFGVNAGSIALKEWEVTGYIES